MDCSPPGSSVRRILQARILDLAAISYSRGSSPPRDWTPVSCVSCTGRWVLYHLCHLGCLYHFPFKERRRSFLMTYIPPLPILLWSSWTQNHLQEILMCNISISLSLNYFWIHPQISLCVHLSTDIHDFSVAKHAMPFPSSSHSNFQQHYMLPALFLISCSSWTLEITYSLFLFYLCLLFSLSLAGSLASSQTLNSTWDFFSFLYAFSLRTTVFYFET